MRKTVESAHYVDKMQSHMNTFGRSRIVQLAIVLLVIFSWIAISNHCAFGAVTAQAEASPVACPFHSKPCARLFRPQRKAGRATTLAFLMSIFTSEN